MWDRPAMGFVDRGLTAGKTYTYRIRATDPLGNTVLGDTAPVTVTSSEPSDYVDAVRADGASSFWRLGESSGPTVYDWAGFADQVAGAGVSRGAQGPGSRPPPPRAARSSASATRTRARRTTTTATCTWTTAAT
jgi:hypothetical protein